MTIIANTTIDEPAFKLGTREALCLNHAPLIVGCSDLENGFGQIDGHGSSMHIGLLSFDEDLTSTPMKTSALLSRKQTGEPIPSFVWDGFAAPQFER